MKRAALIGTGLLALVGQGALALDLDLPAGAEIAFDASRQGSYDMPVGAWDQTLPVEPVAGTVQRTVWQMRTPNGDLAALLAAQLSAQGFESRLACRDRACGGFDFRRMTEIVPEPAMYVDLGDFAFLSAQRQTENGLEAVSILTSQLGEMTYLQLIRVLPEGVVDRTVAISTRTAPVASGAFLQTLEETGHAPLDDLTFGTGAATLDATDYASLSGLADYLLANPDVTVALVGHTDAVGSLDGNIRLSRARAQAVLDLLIQRYGVPADQLSAEGVGFLAPRASNDEQAGREQNRRVEVVVTSTR